MPMAIQFATSADIEDGAAGSYRFISEGFTGERVMSVEDRQAKIGDWSDYSVGVLRELQKLGIEPPPFTLRLRKRAVGAGLSSSASVEVATCLSLLCWSGRKLSESQIALLCQLA